jgi:hypothetical protein
MYDYLGRFTTICVGDNFADVGAQQHDEARAVYPLAQNRKLGALASHVL